MKIATVLGTRPEIIRLSLIIKKLDQYASKHILIHTRQNFTHSLSDVFFQELGLRTPDYLLDPKQHSLGGQLSVMFEKLEEIFLKELPDRVLVLGDTNSALSAILSERMGIPVIHMEAGNRCFDWSVPEEKNRKIIDAVSSINMPYTEQSKANLLREGIAVNRIMVSGNPIYEVLNHYEDRIFGSGILEQLKLIPKQFLLVTVHRAENVDNPVHLEEILKGINLVTESLQHRVICSLHPRTKSRLGTDSPLLLNMHPMVEFYEPFGFFDFVHLEKNALCVLTDSGTVQEECCLFHVPTVTIRNTTERPETIDCGSNVVSGLNAEQIVRATQIMTKQPTDWEIPKGYTDPDVSSKVIKYLLGGRKIIV
ncbi:MULTISPECIES: non-hydrolyzing UDP-N-acetylglucosamine 2-epimerase [unclassified Paenibacillus]|uniref:non-hydrolyzing UDP-N-acetylglucosamine 2-epimerase n=1 Tax=unclassified Paenibacillus TaxID=185978 RepID=UPI00278B11BB|nr:MULTISPECIES: UDP-N-acetylglucosamine 2-epimerase (non-hydrolyzing) [unclassified Paenibacillus]MDQ0901560.1 UDP-N-acetylglucosamine 2-epimerase (non-hydrolyzing) [Paenibacillus sp. V4I7]MDQ0919938.1 UDP-N-acetylglucosamine 2-epimerase (non-hydrolyzing) [Paenibacillus sp. V4I5]